MKKMTLEKLRTLQAIREISEQSSFGGATIKELVVKLGKKRSAVAKMVLGIHLDGFVSNPIFGLWKLTDEGVAAMQLYESPVHRDPAAPATS